MGAGALVATLLLPLLATFLYSISTRWGRPCCRMAFTLDWYLSKLWGDPRFLAAFGRSLLVCFATLLLGTWCWCPPCWWWPTTSQAGSLDEPLDPAPLRGAARGLFGGAAAGSTLTACCRLSARRGS